MNTIREKSVKSRGNPLKDELIKLYLINNEKSKRYSLQILKWIIITHSLDIKERNGYY